MSILQDKLPHTDQYVLRWESDWLVALGKSVQVSKAICSQFAYVEFLIFVFDSKKGLFGSYR